ncbi:MAG: glycosyltransferase family 9 protein, partial [Anaerolineae bacterium]|nr:glycosyltransferase family 9 protein [Anaerolineae bacterium]
MQIPPPTHPNHILIIKPCCIGDVVMTTALLRAIRGAYPQAHITYAVGRWSMGALDGQTAIDNVVDIGESSNPAKGVRGLWRLVRQLRTLNCDMAFIPDRSPLLGLAVWLAGIPHRVGLDSAGRGFAHTVRAVVHPHEEANEGEIYLRLARAINLAANGFYTHIDIPHDAQTHIDRLLTENGIQAPYVVIHPAGGANPGMLMSSKRWLPHNFAQVADWLYQTYGATLILIGAKTDMPIVQAVIDHLHSPYQNWAGELNLMQIGALGASALLYIGNDTGLTHLVAATGAKTVMILGPSSPKRYAPFNPNALAIWKPTSLPAGGVSEADFDWDWVRDGVSVDAVI